MTASSSVVPFPAAKSRKAHARFRDGWLSRLAGDPTLSGSHVTTGVILALHMNMKTRQAWPSIDRIALLTSRSPSTVWRSIGRLKKAGLITVLRGRGRYAPNRYCFVEAPPKTAPTHTLEPFKDCTRAISKTAPLQSELLIEPLNSSRGASRTGRNGNKGAIKNYAWQGQVVRLTQAQLDKWRASYPCLPDLEAVLQKADDYYADNPPPSGKWFFRVSRWLEEENAKHAERRRAAERQHHSW